MAGSSLGQEDIADMASIDAVEVHCLSVSGSEGAATWAGAATTHSDNSSNELFSAPETISCKMEMSPNVKEDTHHPLSKALFQEGNLSFRFSLLKLISVIDGLATWTNYSIMLVSLTELGANPSDVALAFGGASILRMTNTYMCKYFKTWMPFVFLLLATGCCVPVVIDPEAVNAVLVFRQTLVGEMFTTTNLLAGRLVQDANPPLMEKPRFVSRVTKDLTRWWVVGYASAYTLGGAMFEISGMRATGVVVGFLFTANLVAYTVYMFALCKGVHRTEQQAEAEPARQTTEIASTGSGKAKQYRTPCVIWILTTVTPFLMIVALAPVGLAFFQLMKERFHIGTLRMGFINTACDLTGAFLIAKVNKPAKTGTRRQGRAHQLLGWLLRNPINMIANMTLYAIGLLFMGMPSLPIALLGLVLKGVCYVYLMQLHNAALLFYAPTAKHHQKDASRFMFSYLTGSLCGSVGGPLLYAHSPELMVWISFGLAAFATMLMAAVFSYRIHFLQKKLGELAKQTHLSTDHPGSMKIAGGERPLGVPTGLLRLQSSLLKLEAQCREQHVRGEAASVP